MVEAAKRTTEVLSGRSRREQIESAKAEIRRVLARPITRADLALIVSLGVVLRSYGVPGREIIP